MSQFRPKITKIRVCTFQMSGKITDSSKTSPRAPLFAIFGRASGQIFEKMQVLARQGPYSSYETWEMNGQSPHPTVEDGWGPWRPLGFG